MSVFAIADLHLALGAGCESKKMDIFPGWEGYTDRISENWKKIVGEKDSIILPGDLSWSMSLSGALEDLRFVDSLPGTKYILKGNHDYWWATRNKMEQFFAENGLSTLRILHNTAALVEGIAVCGTRGWMIGGGMAADRKIINREAQRLERSIRDADAFPGAEKVVFLHYPPVFAGQECDEIVEVLKSNGIRRCYYGHLHSTVCRGACGGIYGGIRFALVSSDFLSFRPMRIPESAEN